MIGRRYFAIFPNSFLREVLGRFGIDPDDCYPELIEKENYSRERITKAEELESVKAVYATVFINQRGRDLPASRRIEFEQLFANQAFENFWAVEVFEYCEDFRDFVADSQNI